MLETLWKDFEYLIWVDYRDSIIKKANLTATNKNNEITRLEIAVECSDFGSNLEIKAPALSSNKLKISGGRQTNLRRFFFPHMVDEPHLIMLGCILMLIVIILYR